MASAQSSARRDSLLRIVRQRGYLNVAAASRDLAVDASTIRRDLARLEQLGLVERSHGGAIPIRDEEELSFGEKVGRHVIEKRAVAAAVAERIPNGATVMLDSGTTSLMIAQAIREHAGLTVITPDVLVAAELVTRPGIRVIVPGGEAIPSTSTLFSQEGIELVSRLYLDIAIMSVDAVDANGATNLSSVVVPLKRAMLASAAKTYLAVDSSKIGARKLIRVATLDEFTELITDEGADLNEIAAYPVPVVRAPLSTPQELRQR